MFEKWVGLDLLSRLPRAMRHGYAIVLILVGWVLFAFEDAGQISSYFGAMIGLNGQGIFNADTIYFFYTNVILLIILFLASLPLKKWVKTSDLSIFAMLGYAVVFFLSIAYLVDASFNPFLYFRF